MSGSVTLRRDRQQPFPGAEFVELADAAHISDLEQPERFTEAVLRFLSHVP